MKLLGGGSLSSEWFRGQLTSPFTVLAQDIVQLERQVTMPWAMLVKRLKHPVLDSENTYNCDHGGLSFLLCCHGLVTCLNSFSELVLQGSVLLGEPTSVFLHEDS
jgi:hypothetical protein